MPVCEPAVISSRSAGRAASAHCTCARQRVARERRSAPRARGGAAAAQHLKCPKPGRCACLRGAPWATCGPAQHARAPLQQPQAARTRRVSERAPTRPAGSCRTWPTKAGGSAASSAAVCARGAASAHQTASAARKCGHAPRAVCAGGGGAAIRGRPPRRQPRAPAAAAAAPAAVAAAAAEPLAACRCDAPRRIEPSFRARSLTSRRHRYEPAPRERETPHQQTQ